MDDKTLIKALRCISTAGASNQDCESCPYFFRKQIPEDLQKKLKNKWWSSCDVDKVGMDAAARLEELTGGAK